MPQSLPAKHGVGETIVMASVAFDGTKARCRIFSFKEGLLSAAGHDLELEVARFTGTVDTDKPSIEASFEASSIKVLHAIKSGSPDPGALSEGDRKTIEQNAVNDVLELKKFPDVRFRSTKIEGSAGRYNVSGTLTLHGTSRPVSFSTQNTGDYVRAETSIDTTEFGIKPFKALLGALKVKTTIKVVFEIPISVVAPA